MWVSAYGSAAGSDAGYSFHHRTPSGWARYDTIGSCLKGNSAEMLAVDAQGDAIVDTRHFYGLGGPSTGVYRISEGVCEEIPLGFGATDKGAVAYARDSRNREYFGVREISDTPLCHGVLRLGTSLESFLESGPGSCVASLAANGGKIDFASRDAFGFIQDGEATVKTTVKGIEFIGAMVQLKDSRGDLWIGTGGTEYNPGAGLLRIRGDDTVLYRGGATGFDTRGVMDLAEDGEGNVWVFSADGVWIRLRDQGRIPVALSRRPIRVAPARHRSDRGRVDAAGRRPIPRAGTGLRFGPAR